MKNQWLIIKQIDRQLKEWQTLRQKYSRPKTGWVKTLRTALCMTAEQFAGRLGLSRARVNQLESAEVNNAITLRSLQEAANALECELVYAIVPKANSTLESIIKKRAEQIAKERIANVAHSMSLENQSIDNEILKMQKNELTKDLIENINKKFWEQQNSKANSLQKLIKNIKKKP